MKSLSFILLAGIFFSLSAPALPKFAPSAAPENDPYEMPPAMAVENRAYTSKHDLTAQVGILPLDAFYKALTYGISYTYAWQDYLHWEVFNGALDTVQDTGLKTQLLDKFNVHPTGILDSPKFTMSSNVIYTPIYMKCLFFNRDVVHGEVSLVGGAGVVGWTSGENSPMVGGGVILRFFKSETSSIKIDNRLYYHTGQEKSSNLLLMMMVGFSFELGGSSERK